MFMKVAIVHDFLLKLGGAERVTKALADMFPDAPIYCILYDEEKVGTSFPKERIRSSFLQKYPKFLRKRPRFLTHKMPRAVEEMCFQDFDLVISSSSAFTHGIIVPLETQHLCYCHSPMRYSWDWANEYKKENDVTGLKALVYSFLIKYLRQWDRVSADRPDKYLANSEHVRKRLKKYYTTDSTVVFPPVETDRFRASEKNEGYFLIVSTLTPYKKVDLAVQLFNKIGRQLVVIGDGPHLDYLKEIAGDNIEFLGFKDDETVKEYLENCRALIFPGEEDFGITPLEAMACGKPVLAYAKGGVKETVVSGKTGEFFFEQNVEAMEDGLARLIYNSKFYKPHTVRRHALNFSKENFEKKILSEIRKLRKQRSL